MPQTLTRRCYNCEYFYQYDDQREPYGHCFRFAPTRHDSVTGAAGQGSTALRMFGYIANANEVGCGEFKQASGEIPPHPPAP